jgi:hypothetical protein
MAKVGKALRDELIAGQKKVAIAKPDPYANMPADVANAMRASDKRNVMGKAKAAQGKGTVTGGGKYGYGSGAKKRGQNGNAGIIDVGGRK